MKTWCSEVTISDLAACASFSARLPSRDNHDHDQDGGGGDHDHDLGDCDHDHDYQYESLNTLLKRVLSCELGQSLKMPIHDETGIASLEWLVHDNYADDHLMLIII